MSTITFRNGRKVGKEQPPYIIAELNTSHFGKVDLAKEMIESAKKIGADCVKFQSWSDETLYSKAITRQTLLHNDLLRDTLFQKKSYLN